MNLLDIHHLWGAKNNVLELSNDFIRKYFQI
jgi:hypothetical protein